MTEEERGEQTTQAQDESVPEPQEQDTETPQESEDDGGKLGTLEKELDNLKGVLGRQGDELGQLRNENAYYKQQQGQQQQGFQQPSQYPPQQAGTTEEEWDWTDPKAVDRRIESRVGQVVQQFRVENARGAFQRGQSVMERDRESFKGIEQEVTQLMQGMYGMNPNMPAAFLENPSSWYGLADVIKGQKARTANAPRPVNPVAPTPTETPSSVKQREPERGKTLQFNETSRKLIRELDMKEEEAEERVLEERKWRDK